MNEDEWLAQFQTPRFKDLARRAIEDPDAPICDVDWAIDGVPHGCCLPPGHDGVHWCSCNAELAL